MSTNLSNPLVVVSDREMVQDSECRYLYLRIGKKNRSWMFYKSWRGKPIRLKVGDCKTMRLSEARVQARKIAEDLAAGIDPRKLTVQKLFNRYFQQHVRVRNARPLEIRRAVERHWTKINNVNVEELRTYQVQAWFTAIGETSEACANKELHRLRACINWGIAQDLIVLMKNPCTGVREYPENNRERYLTPGQAKRLVAEINKLPETTTRDALLLLFYTFLRKSNVTGMRWDWIDFENRQLIIPARNAKARKPIYLPLSELAFDLLTRRFENRHEPVMLGDYEWFPGKSPFVFPSKGALGHTRNIDNAWRKVRERAGLSNWHIHDMRHAGGAALGMNGESAFVIQKLLSHASITSSRRYVALDNQSSLEAVERAHQRLFG